MSKLDLKKELKEYYNPKTKADIINVPSFNFLMLDGIGEPASEDFKIAVEKLFKLSYKIKFGCKKETGIDYSVMPLEGLWWADDMEDFIKDNRKKWKWTLMIMQLNFIDKKFIEKIKKEILEKDKSANFDKVIFDKYEEGLSTQIMHIGPFSSEHENIMKLHDLIKENSGELSGKHHEIYLNDFRRVSPDKMKTIIRQPFKK